MLDEYAEAHPGLFRFVRFDENRGLHVAMREGVVEAGNSLIMRMDADDYSRPDRAEKQLAAFAEDSSLELVGSNAVEFIGTPDNVVAEVNLPESHEAIARFARRRNPFRHDAVLYRKEAVLAAGNYHDTPYFEDYDLFIRMLGAGSRAKNIQEPLIAIRVSPDFYQRRGGTAYLKHTTAFLKKCRANGLLSLGDCIVTFVPRALVCIMPNKLRLFVYQRMLRTNSATQQGVRARPTQLLRGNDAP